MNASIKIVQYGPRTFEVVIRYADGYIACLGTYSSRRDAEAEMALIIEREVL